MSDLRNIPQNLLRGFREVVDEGRARFGPLGENLLRDTERQFKTNPAGFIPPHAQQAMANTAQALEYTDAGDVKAYQDTTSAALDAVARGSWADAAMNAPGVAASMASLMLPGLGIGGAIKPVRSLPMDAVSVAARQKELGFNTDLYHGTTFDFDEFKTSPRRKTYLTDDPKIANIYADATQRHTSYGIEPNAGPNVVPLRARMENPLEVSDVGPDGSHGWFSDNLYTALGIERDALPGADGYRKLFDIARERGHDFVVMRDYTDLGGDQSQYIPLDMSHVRSRFAKFDPAKKGSSDLLASVGIAGTVGLAATRDDER